MDTLDSVQLDPFLVNKLGLADWKIQKEGNPLGLIKNVVYKYITHPQYAFQNLGLASTPPTQRIAPTQATSINQCVSTLRGMCIDHNYFLAVLFKSIGYDAFIVGSTVSLLPMPLNHPLCIIRLDGGLWLVDMGMGSVFHQPIPLHQLPTSFNVGGFVCEYREAEGGIFQRVHITGDPMKGDFDVPEEVRYHFTLEPMKYEDFHPAMHTIFTDAETSFFLNNLYAFRYLSLNLGQTTKFQAIAFMGTTLIRYSEKDFSKTVYESYEEIEPIFVQNFQQIPAEQFKEATKYFQTSKDRKH